MTRNSVVGTCRGFEDFGYATQDVISGRVTEEVVVPLDWF
jgi:hypothetical protein